MGNKLRKKRKLSSLRRRRINRENWKKLLQKTIGTSKQQTSVQDNVIPTRKDEPSQCTSSDYAYDVPLVEEVNLPTQEKRSANKGIPVEIPQPKDIQIKTESELSVVCNATFYEDENFLEISYQEDE